MLIWGWRNISYYYQCWKQLCSLIFCGIFFLLFLLNKVHKKVKSKGKKKKVNLTTRTSKMSPRDRSPVRTSSPRHPSGKDPRNQWTTYTLTLLQLEQTTDLSGRRGTGPPTEPGFPQGFFSILSLMEFSFLAAVASGLLSWGHFISSTIIDLIAQILFKLN